LGGLANKINNGYEVEGGALYPGCALLQPGGGIFFNSEEDYQQALRSNTFTKEAVAQTLEISVADIIGCYRADNCQAIKISTYRPLISGSPGERDVFGAQQHLPLLLLNIPVF